MKAEPVDIIKYSDSEALLCKSKEELVCIIQELIGDIRKKNEVIRHLRDQFDESLKDSSQSTPQVRDLKVSEIVEEESIHFQEAPSKE